MIYAISAQTRTKLGRQAKQELHNDRIPGVIYGHGVAARHISVPRSEFVRVFKQAGYSSLIDVTMGTEAPVKMLLKEVQKNPLTTEPIHIDFYQVRMDEEMTAMIPLKFVGESAAVKTLGGTLIKSLDEIEVRCLPADLPHEIEVDLSALATFEDSIGLKSLSLPKGVESTGDETLTVATVARPLTEEELKKMEEVATVDITAIKTEGEEKKAAEAAKKAEEEAADAAK